MGDYFVIGVYFLTFTHSSTEAALLLPFCLVFWLGYNRGESGTSWRVLFLSDCGFVMLSRTDFAEMATRGGGFETEILIQSLIECIVRRVDGIDAHWQSYVSFRNTA
jgi:hypothetical protein